MIDKLKTVYINCLYKLSLLGTSVLKTTMLHLIELNGLDPNSNPATDRIKQLENLLNMPSSGLEFKNKEDFYSTHASIQKMKDAVARRTKELQTFGHVGRIKRAAPKVPTDVAYVTPESIKDTVDKLMAKYKPAYEANPPPGTPVFEVFSESPGICEVEDKLVFDALDLAVAAEESANHAKNNKKIAVEKSKIKKKPTKKSMKKPAKKAIKKPVKKNRKK